MLTDLWKQEHRLVRIERQHPGGVELASLRILPPRNCPIRIDRPRQLNAFDRARRVKLPARERVLAREFEFARAGQQDVAVDVADDFNCAVGKRAAESELQQHQQHRKRDAAGRAEQTALVGQHVAPRQRNRRAATSQR